jgi:hypothetical protein
MSISSSRTSTASERSRFSDCCCSYSGQLREDRSFWPSRHFWSALSSATLFTLPRLPLWSLCWRAGCALALTLFFGFSAIAEHRAGAALRASFLATPSWRYYELRASAGMFPFDRGLRLLPEIYLQTLRRGDPYSDHLRGR